MVGAYPFVDPDGRPSSPSCSTTRDTGQIWDAYAWDELPEATLSLALYFTFFNHAVKDASWVQKYRVNVQLQGLTVAGEGTRAGRGCRLTPRPSCCSAPSGRGREPRILPSPGGALQAHRRDPHVHGDDR